MKTSKKLRNQILNAISAGTMSCLDEYCPFHKDGPPETWNDDEKKLWDQINEVERRAVEAVRHVLSC